MRTKLCWGVFTLLVVLFIISVPLSGLIHLRRDFRDFVVPLGVLGALLIILVAVTGMSVLLKGFLIGTGAAALGWSVSLYLHSILIRFSPNEPFTYILFFYICTPAFIIGAAGTIIIGIKQLASSH